MRTLGVLFIAIGIAIAAYVGIWVCLVGGIIGLVHAFKAPGGVDAGVVAWNVIKILFSETFAGLAGCVPIFLGMSCIEEA